MILLSKKYKNIRAGNITPVLVTVILGALVGSILIGNAIGQGRYLEGYLFLLLLVFLVMLQYLKKSFWLAIPFFIEADLPAIPLGFASITGGEMWILLCCLFIMLYWVGRRELSFNLRELWPVYFYGIWAFVIFLNNPVGLQAFGASSGGFRFYVMIGLSTIACAILSNAKINSADAKKITILFIIAAFTKISLNLLQLVFPSLMSITAKSGNASASDFYGLQFLAIFPAMIAPVLFSKYNIKDLINPRFFWVTGAYLLCLALVLVSGKRSLAVMVLITPFLAEIIKGRVIPAVIVMCGAISVISTLFLIHTSGIRLKPEIQRVLSIVPIDVKWDNDVIRSADNSFRETLNRMAFDEIKLRPVLGEGYVINNDFLFHLENNPDLVLEKDEHIAGAGHAVNSNWHNTWLGVCADFGFPGLIIYISLVIIFTKKSFKVLRILDDRSNLYTLTILMLLLVLIELLRSWQFGHSALSFYSISWKFGLLIAIQKSILITSNSSRKNEA